MDSSRCQGALCQAPLSTKARWDNTIGPPRDRAPAAGVEGRKATRDGSKMGGARLQPSHTNEIQNPKEKGSVRIDNTPATLSKRVVCGSQCRTPQHSPITNRFYRQRTAFVSPRAYQVAVIPLSVCHRLVAASWSGSHNEAAQCMPVWRPYLAYFGKFMRCSSA